MMQTVQNVGGAAARVNVWVSTYWYEKCEQDKNVNSVTDHEHVRFVYFCTEDLFKIFLLVRLFPNNFKLFFQYKKRRKKEIVCG